MKRKEAKIFFCFSRERAKRMRNGSRFASFRFEAKIFFWRNRRTLLSSDPIMISIKFVYFTLFPTLSVSIIKFFFTFFYIQIRIRNPELHIRIRIVQNYTDPDPQY